MLITKFNKLIKSRILWGLLAFIIAFAFVGASVVGKMSGDASKSFGIAGKIYNKEISMVDFQQAKSFELGMRQNINLTEEQTQILRNRTWERFGALEYARKMGLSASEAEVKDAMKNEQAFQVNGRFNQSRFLELLAGMGMTEAGYIEFVRQEIITQKLRNIFLSSVWTEPREVQDRASNLMDVFKVEYIHMAPDTLLKDFNVSAEDARKYYDDNKERFETPMKINVRYVKFSLENYTKDISTDESEAEKYYDINMEDYSTTDTNGVSVPTPFADVKDEIIKTLNNEKAMEAAENQATDFVMKLAPSRFGKGIGFDAAASAFKTTISTTELFSVSDTIPGIDAGLNFNRIAFSLDPDDEEKYFSDAITGTSNVYVIAVHERIQPRIPDFDEVKDDVVLYASEKLKMDALDKAAGKIRDSLSEKISSGVSFTAASTDMSFNVVTTKTFTVYEGMFSNDIEYASVIMPSVAMKKQGELTDLLQVEDGTLLAFVAERTAGDAFSTQSLKPQIVATLERYRAGLTYNDWLTYNLSQADLDDYYAKQLKMLSEPSGPAEIQEDF